jgi:hypothetical protein
MEQSFGSLNGRARLITNDRLARVSVVPVLMHIIKKKLVFAQLVKNLLALKEQT